MSLLIVMVRGFFETQCTCCSGTNFTCSKVSCIISEIKRYIGRKSRFFHNPLHSTPPLWGCPHRICRTVWYRKTRMVWLPGRWKSLIIRIIVSTEYWRVTDRRTDGRTDIFPQHSPRYAYASRVKTDISKVVLAALRICMPCCLCAFAGHGLGRHAVTITVITCKSVVCCVEGVCVSAWKCVICYIECIIIQNENESIQYTCHHYVYILVCLNIFNIVVCY